jgi:poly-gamma-glutamate capsule biosynthesis protein CapA/YwtB (metallophosphatase superfamily)
VATYGDTTVAFLSFSHILPAGFIATDSKAGLAPGRTDMDAVAAAMPRPKTANDYVLVSFHWGVEYVDDANADQVRDGRTAIDAGADMVLSHHPHVIQGVEFYNGGLIAYSLGDFVFDHYSRKTGEAFILEAELGPARGRQRTGNVPGLPLGVRPAQGRDRAPRRPTSSSASKRSQGPTARRSCIEGDVARVLP